MCHLSEQQLLLMLRKKKHFMFIYMPKTDSFVWWISQLENIIKKYFWPKQKQNGDPFLFGHYGDFINRPAPTLKHAVWLLKCTCKHVKCAHAYCRLESRRLVFFGTILIVCENIFRLILLQDCQRNWIQ